MPDPQRYDLVTNYRCGESIEELERDDDGEWVRWEDVQAEVERLRAEVKEEQEHCLAAERHMLEAEAKAEDAEAERDQLRQLVLWALGESETDEFPDLPGDWPKRKFYWRSTLRAKFNALAGSSPTPETKP